MKVVIIGGVAGGAGTAARLRRLDENMEIILIEKGPDISYANCGLPYSIGKVIKERSSLLVMTAEKFSKRFNVDVRTSCEALEIDRSGKELKLKDLKTGQEYSEKYDKLVVSTGSTPLIPPFSGTDLPGVHRLWTLQDMDKLEAILQQGPRKVLVVGGGFVGVELAENLLERGCEAVLVQRESFLLPSLDVEMSNLIVAELRSLGIRVEMQAEITEINQKEEKLEATLADGRKIDTDLMVLCVGVRPNSDLAKKAGLNLGPRGHIVTDEHLCTSDPDIYAVGDVIEVKDPIFEGRTAIPLAGPANRQARIAADNICGGNSEYLGTWGTSIIKAGNLIAANTGYCERQLDGKIDKYQKIYLHPQSHATYYPGGTPLHIKVLFAEDGKLLGAQIVGYKGVDKRIDVLSTAMFNGMKVQDLAALELAYAPPFSSAKDPVNFIGMIAENMQRGITTVAHFDELPENAFLVDIRECDEHDISSIPNSIVIPLNELRSRHHELPRDKKIYIYCQSGVRSYIAERVLKQRGYENTATLAGGYLTWKLYQEPAKCPVITKEKIVEYEAESRLLGTKTKASETIDLRSLACPGPVITLKQTIEKLSIGQCLELLAQNSFEPDLRSWCNSSGNFLLSSERRGDHFQAIVCKQEFVASADDSAASPCAAAAATGGTPAVSKGAAMVLFSNDLDKAMAALIIACGMAAAGQKVGIFFTFWGLSVLRKNPAPAVKKNFLSRMFGWMLPKGPEKLALSKMNMLGAGTAMMKNVMKEQNVSSLPELIKQARELGVKFIACEMAMDVMGITREELIEVDEVAGVASFVDMAGESNSTLFI